MTTETSQPFEQDQSKYKDFRDMLADNSLSPEEVEDLHERYDADREAVAWETRELSADLRKEVEQYKEMTDMSREQIQKLQILTWIPKNQIDGLRGPMSFAQYQLFTDILPELWNPWPRELSEQYDEIFDTAKSQFNSLSMSERKNIQSQIGSGADGVFWPNTFQKICENISADESLKVFLTGALWSEEEITPIPVIQAEQEETIVVNNASETWDVEIQDIPDVARDETVEINPEALKSDLREQSRLYSPSLIRELQIALGDIWVDGAFWNESATRILEKYPQLTNLEDVFAAEWINTDVDGILSRDGSPEVFRNLYGEYIDRLWADLWLPDGFIQAIIKKETTYGAGLNSPTGSKWMMQLTKWPFKDMRGDHGDTIWVDSRKVLRYQEVFQRIDLDALLAVQVWDEWVAQERIPSEIIAHLETVQNSENVSEIQQSITALFEHIKGNKNEYDHETNMIIWSVYLAYQYDRADWNLWQSARNYNGDRKIASNGKQTRDNYADTVMRYFREIGREDRVS